MRLCLTLNNLQNLNFANYFHSLIRIDLKGNQKLRCLYGKTLQSTLLCFLMIWFSGVVKNSVDCYRIVWSSVHTKWAFGEFLKVPA